MRGITGMIARQPITLSALVSMDLESKLPVLMMATRIERHRTPPER